MDSTYGLNVIKIGDIWIFQGGAKAYRLWSAPRGAYNNWKHLKLWESGLFSGYYIWITCHQNRRYFNAHFRTRISYSSQKSCVKIWFGLVEPFKSYHLNFPWGQKPPIRGTACDLQCPFLDLAELFQSKVICVNLVRIGWAFQELSRPQTFFYGAETPY